MMTELNLNWNRVSSTTWLAKHEHINIEFNIIHHNHIEDISEYSITLLDKKTLARHTYIAESYYQCLEWMATNINNVLRNSEIQHYAQKKIEDELTTVLGDYPPRMQNALKAMSNEDKLASKAITTQANLATTKQAIKEVRELEKGLENLIEHANIIDQIAATKLKNERTIKGRLKNERTKKRSTKKA